MAGLGYERKSPPRKSTSALPAIADLGAAMSVFDPPTTGSLQEADIRATEADVRF